MSQQTQSMNVREQIEKIIKESKEWPTWIRQAAGLEPYNDRQTQSSGETQNQISVKGSEK